MVQRERAEILRLSAVGLQPYGLYVGLRRGDAYDVVEDVGGGVVVRRDESLLHQVQLTHAVEGVCADVGRLFAQAHHIPSLLVELEEIRMEHYSGFRTRTREARVGEDGFLVVAYRLKHVGQELACRRDFLHVDPAVSVGRRLECRAYGIVVEQPVGECLVALGAVASMKYSPSELQPMSIWKFSSMARR